MRCLDRLGANVLIQADANDGEWTGPDGTRSEWQPLSWMGSAYRAVSDPSVHFTYAVNPFMVGNLADTPIRRTDRDPPARPARPRLQLRRHRRVRGGPGPRRLSGGRRAQATVSGPRPVGGAQRRAGPRCGAVGSRLITGQGPFHYVQTAVIADLPFPAPAHRPGCLMSGTMSPISRREALIGAAGATAARAGRGRRRPRRAARTGQRARRADVVVVGAGLAGLVPPPSWSRPATRWRCSRRATASADAR